MPSSTDPSDTITLRPALPPNANPLQTAQARRDACAAAATEAMHTLHCHFYPTLHPFAAPVDGQDALALQLKAWVSFTELGKAEEEVRELEARREVEGEAKMVAGEEGGKGGDA